jgi:hypothetical protein
MELRQKGIEMENSNDPLRNALASLVKTIDAIICFGVALTLVALWQYGRTAEDNSCKAGSYDDACTISFQKGTQEDDFNFDYANGKLTVWVMAKGHD